MRVVGDMITIIRRLNIADERDTFRYHDLKVRISKMQQTRILRLVVRVCPEEGGEQA